MGMKRIEFNVDYGINLKAKDLEKHLKKQVDGQMDKLQDCFDKGEKIQFKLNLNNAVDLDGNAIDKKSIDAFTRQYEKTINSALNVMIDKFKGNLSTEISDAVSESLSADISKLFADMSDMIVEGITKMQNDIMSALSNIDPVSINQEYLVKFDNGKQSTNAFNGLSESIVNDAEKEFDKADEGLAKRALEFRKHVKELKEDIAKEKKRKKELEDEKSNRKNPNSSENDFKVKIGRKNYTNKVVDEIKNDSKELEKVLNDFYAKYQKKYEAWISLGDKYDIAQEKGIDTTKITEDTKKLEQELDNIAFVIQKLVSNPTELSKLISVEDNSYITEIFREIEVSTSNFKDKTVQQLQELIDESESKIGLWTQSLEEAEKKIEEFGKKSNSASNKVPDIKTSSDDVSENIQEKVTTSETKKGKTKYNAKVQIYPELNTDSFLKQVMKAVDACEEALKEDPIEIPITSNPESIGEFIVDVQNSLLEKEMKIVLDKNDFISQIKEATDGVNVNINGSLSGVSVHAGSINNATNDEYDEESWSYLESQAFDGLPEDFVLDDFISQVKNQIAGASQEAEELSQEMSAVNQETKEANQEIVNTNSNLEKTVNTAKKIRESFKETATILGGKQDENYINEEVKILKDKLKAYEIIDDLRKRVVPKGEERKLALKEDRTDEENKRLKELREVGTKRRKKIKSEWDSLSPVLKNINELESMRNSSENLLNELNNLESRKKLTPVQNNRLNDLRSNKSRIEESIESTKRLINENLQSLQSIKEKSSFFGDMSDRALLELQQEVVGDNKDAAKKFDYKKVKKPTTLINNAITRLQGIENSSVGSPEYSEAYRKSYEKITKNSLGKQGVVKNSMLEKELLKLRKQDEFWQGINKAVQDAVKDSDTDKNVSNKDVFGDRFKDLNNRLQDIQKKKITADQKYEKKKKGYTYSQYEKEINELSLEEDKIKKQLENEERAAKIYKKYGKDKIKEIADNIHKERELYEQDVKTQSGTYDRVDKLRHQDLKSFAQYKLQKEEQKKRVEKQKSYDEQISEHKQELINSGMSEKESEYKKYEILKGTDYKSNNNLIEEYRRQFGNLEADLNEILSLMSKIDTLQKELSNGTVSVDQENQLKRDLFTQREALEKVVSRTGWQSGDILAYKDYKKKLGNEPSSAQLPDIKKFEQGANSVRDVVNNITKEIEVAEKENRELINSVKEAENRLNTSKQQIATNYQNTASQVREALEQLKKQEASLKEEIDKSTDPNEISAKRISLGKVQEKIKNVENKNKDFLNNTRLQARIDKDFSLSNADKLDEIKKRKSQILVNEDYINSLKRMKEEQEELRRIKEPTKDELSARNTDLVTQRSQSTKQYLQNIKQTKQKIEDIKIEIQNAEEKASQSISNIDEEISKLNATLEIAENKLKEIKSREVNNIKNQTNTSSDLYSEYTIKQGEFSNELGKKQQVINSSKSELGIINRELDEMSNKYKDGINKQGFIVRKLKEQIELEEQSVQKQIDSGISKDKIDQSNLVTLQKQLEIEQKKKEEMESQYTLASELNKRQEVIAVAERIDRTTSIAKRNSAEGNNAKEDLLKDVRLMEQLSEELVVNFGEVVTIVDRAGNKFTTMRIDMDKINDMSSDIGRYNLLQTKKTGHEDILQTTQLPDENIYKGTKKEYSEKIRSAFVEEQRLYNAELQKSQDYIRETGDLTEEAENHLLNMHRYMQEYGTVAGVRRKDLFGEFGIDKDTEQRMKFAWNDAKSMIYNTSKSSENIYKEEAEQQKIVNALKEQIRLKEISKDSTNNEVNSLKAKLKSEEELLAKLKRRKQEENSITSAEQKENEQRIKDMSKPKGYKAASNIADNSVKEKEEQLKKVAQVDEQVAQEQVVNQKEIEQAVEEVNNELKEQSNIVQAANANTVQSVITKQQQEAQEEIKKTDELLQQQITKAVQSAQISIAEGSSVSISGSVKIDDGQFGFLNGNLSSVEQTANQLLTVVKNIYATISNGTTSAISDIKSFEAPLNDVKADVKEVGEVFEEVQVQLSQTGKKLEVVSGGNIDLKKYQAVQHAIDEMNQAISSNHMLKEIKDSGNIKAKYYTKQDEDGNINEYVALNSVFKDTQGRVIQLNHVYDVTARTMNEVGSATVQMSNKFEQQNKAMQKADAQLHAHLNKLDKLKIKYETFDIGNFGIDESGNLFAKVGTDAEKTFDIITGRTKDLIKDVILQMSEVENKFKEFKDKSGKGVLSTDEFENLSKELSIAVEKLENSMNAVNRRVTTQLEHTSRSWMSTWQRELSGAEAFVYNADGTDRLDSSMYNAKGIQYIEQYKDALLDLKELYHALHEQGEYFTDDQVNNWKRQMQTILELKKAINSNESKPYVNGLGVSLDEYSFNETQFKALISDSTYARNALSDLAKQITGTDIEVVKLSKDNQSLTYTFKDQDKNVQTCKLSVSDYGKTIRNTSVDSKKHVGLLSMAFGSLKDKLMQIFKYVSAYEIFYKVVNAVRNGVTIVRELDTSLTEMRKVSDESVQSLRNFQKASFDIAKSVGTTAAQIQNSTADFLRLGESLDEAEKSAETANILLNVSEFESIDEATESLVSMSAAYSDLEKIDIVNKLNLVGNNFAISTDGLATALQDSASALKTAQNDIDQSIALATAANAVVQDPNKVGAGKLMPEHIVICGYLYTKKQL